MSREKTNFLSRLLQCFGVLLSFMPIFLPIWGWRFWYLRPFIIYASLAPYCFLTLVALSSLPCTLCALLGILEGAQPILIRYAYKFLWFPYMNVMHGYEVEGMENLPPRDKGALIVFYHGVTPIDAIFLNGVIFEKLGRIMGGTVHRNILRIPFIGNVAKTFGFSADGRTKMIHDLKQGALRAVAPGGDYETLFSENYSVEFLSRCGFAAAAKEAGVPIIPMFTENIREFQRCHFFGCKALFKKLWEEHRLAFLLGFGGLPVKLRTHLGRPIHCGKDEAPGDFAKRVRKAIEDLRDENQMMDGSMFRALLDRIG